jgi:dihydroxyacetone kinase
MDLGGAKPGDRTMVDALAPAVEAWKKSGSFADAVKAADAGAKATSDMFPALGRASYLGKRAVGFPDGGATAVAIWLGAIGASISR